MLKYILAKTINKTNYYKYLLAVFFTFFSGLSYSDSFVFNFGSAQEYIGSINNIRENIADALPNVPGVRALNSSDSYSHVRFVSERSNTIDIVLSDRNLYMVGFVSAGVFYRFNDREFSNITVPDTTLLPMNLSSHYSRLSSTAERVRADVIVDQITINNAIDNLWDMNGNGTVSLEEARSLLTLIIGVSESVRFGNISSFISGNYNNHVPIGGLYSITNQWGDISDYALRMSQNASSDTGYYSVTTHAISRSQLYGYLAVANCMSGRARMKASHPQGECSSGEGIVLIGNTYWPKNLIAVLID